jgi:hypothetical protein
MDAKALCEEVGMWKLLALTANDTCKKQVRSAKGAGTVAVIVTAIAGVASGYFIAKKHAEAEKERFSFDDNEDE